MVRLVMVAAQEWPWTSDSPKCSPIGKAQAIFHQAAISTVTCHSDSTLVLTGSVDGSVCLSHIRTGKVLKQFQDHDDGIETMGFSHTR